jgi:glycosyltransferase involved in cell wall biosynthesis
VKVLHVNSSDLLGGAARGAYRIHRALRSIGIESFMRVALRASDDWSVNGPPGKLARLLAPVRPAACAAACRLFGVDQQMFYSPAALPSGLHRELNASDADLVHLHWLGAELLSIEEIGRISKPLVWTFHDMWPFCGAEHYAPDTPDARFRLGYRRDNRPAGERGWDLNRWCWERKRRAWKRQIAVACNSHWLARCARESALLNGWPIETIHYPIDTQVWRPIDRQQARMLLRLPREGPIVLFGAVGGSAEARKGADLLYSALDRLAGRRQTGICAAVFGESEPKTPRNGPIPIRYFGRLQDDLTLCLLYSAADVMVVPSRQEAFGQTAAEAHACGTPVVAFDIGGLPDTIEHLKTGYLARPFEVDDLARGISWVVEQRGMALGEAARRKAEACFSVRDIAEKYASLYDRVLSSS